MLPIQFPKDQSPQHDHPSQKYSTPTGKPQQSCQESHGPWRLNCPQSLPDGHFWGGIGAQQWDNPERDCIATALIRPVLLVRRRLQCPWLSTSHYSAKLFVKKEGWCISLCVCREGGAGSCRGKRTIVPQRTGVACQFFFLTGSFPLWLWQTPSHLLNNQYCVSGIPGTAQLLRSPR